MKSGNGVVKLSLIADGDTLAGTVSGKTLNLRIGSSPIYVDFTGTKP
jgi:hypothetical protein